MYKASVLIGLIEDLLEDQFYALHRVCLARTAPIRHLHVRLNQKKYCPRACRMNPTTVSFMLIVYLLY